MPHFPYAGMHVETKRDLQEVFDYPEVRNFIGSEKDSWRITKILENHEDFFMLDLITGTETILSKEPFSGIFPIDEKQRTVILNALETLLKEKFSIKDSLGICNSIRRVTSGGIRKLSSTQAYEVLLFSTLFAYVQKTPSEDDEVYLQKLLKQQSQEPVLDLIQNNTQNTIVIPTVDSPLRRHLASGEQILALTISGKVITFLPRICALDGLVMYRKSSRLVAQDRNEKEVMSLDDPNVRIFSRSDDYGLLAADEHGIFIQEYCTAEGPDSEILWLRGDQDDYGFLLADGSYQGKLPKNGWNNLLSFDLCNGGAIAVTQDRKAIGESGEILGENIAAVSCCAQRWILLRLDGSVVTDQGELSIPEKTGRAVCADAEGYWVSTNNKLLRIESNTIVEEYDNPMDEIWQDNFGTTVCGLSTDGIIHFLR